MYTNMYMCNYHCVCVCVCVYVIYHFVAYLFVCTCTSCLDNSRGIFQETKEMATPAFQLASRIADKRLQAWAAALLTGEGGERERERERERL